MPQLEPSRYGIGDLAELAGVSRRTVRYYVQESLLPPPLGVGRGDHYGPEHLDQLLRVKAMQEAGRTLEEIRLALSPAAAAGRERMPRAEPPDRAVWRRITLAPGLELHVASGLRLPPPGKLDELARWCRLHFAASRADEDADA